MQRLVGGIEIEVVDGDIASQGDVAVVVNAANAWLRPGGGVAGAIHRAAGPGLDEECRAFAPIRPGEAVITGAHGLPNQHVIHCLGPVHGVDNPADELLASCHRNALALADARGLDAIAFPAISTGVFGYPLDEAAVVSVGAVAGMAPRLRHVKRVRFVLHGRAALAAFERALARLPGGEKEGKDPGPYL